MMIVGSLLQWLFGRGLTLVTLPALALYSLTITHQHFEGRREALRGEGERRCDTRWERQIREQEQLAIERERAADRAMLKASADAVEGLENERKRLEIELAALRGDGSGDARCLSQRVLDAIGPKAAANSGGAGQARSRPAP